MMHSSSRADTEDSGSIRCVLEQAMAEADRRRKRVRWGLATLAGALLVLLLVLLLLGGQL
jgi:predicted nucleic acid-binding Zn ribbon protein